MQRYFSILVFICFILANNSFADDSKCQRSTEGKEFWFGFMEGRNDNGNVHYIEVTVTAREATNYSVYYGKSTTPIIRSVGNNSSDQFKINPLTLAEATGSENIQDRAIHIISEKPVNVYAMNWDKNSSDVAVIYPVESLGTSYFAICYTPRVDTRPEHGRNSEFLVVASEDNTTVTITPSVVTDQLKPANIPFDIILNKGEVYQVQSMNRQNLSGQGDLTGSFIKSDKPVAFYSGNFSVTIPATQGQGGYNHLFEQIPPLSAWGREYFAVPFVSRLADTYRIIASEDNTKVQIGNQAPITIDKGKFYEFNLSNNQPSRIYADKAILVAQFSRSNTTDQSYTGGNGDPFMIVLSPVNQSKNDVTFVAYNSAQIKNYSINIVTLSSEINNIELDGRLIENNFSPFTGTKYSYAQVSVGNGNHRLLNRNPEKGFLAYVYGYGGYESYGYGVGFNLDLILDLGQSIEFYGDTLPLCKGQTITLDAGSHFDYYLWNTGEKTQKIVADKQSQYWAIGTTKEGCQKKDSIFILVSDPVKPDLGADVEECFPYNKKLDAGTGYKKYEWNTGETSQTLNIDRTGNYIVTVWDKYNCPASDQMKLTVFQVPEIKMTSPLIICGTKKQKIELKFSGVEDSIVSKGIMVWKASQPAKLFTSDETNTSTDIEVTDWGNYDVSYTFTTPDGCVVQDTLNVKFAEIPASKFKFADDTNDKCKGYYREVVYDGNATQNANYYWNFGNSLAEPVDWNRWRVSLSPGNSKAKVALFVEENGCFSPDTFELDIAANPDFVMNTVKSRGCDSAKISFSGELKVPDNLEFEWNFGDGSAISALQKPDHLYNKTGFYDVSLKITNTDNGCFIGFTEEEMVKIFPTPNADFAIDPSTCTDSLIRAVYINYIDSSLCSWDLTGAHQVGKGNDSILVLIDNPTGTIRLQVDEFGCKSIRAEKTATRKPFFDIDAEPTQGCQPLEVTTRAVSSDEGLVFSWLTDSLISEGNEHIFQINKPGKFGFELVARSEITGCYDTIFRPGMVEVYPKPNAVFEVDYPVAIIENANLTFTNLTEDVNKFNWDFGDGDVSELENPQHQYTTVGKYPVRLIVQSGYECKDTTFSDVEILPFTAYTPNAFRPDSEIPENRLFMPITVGVDPDSFSLFIFNRWGELVFETHDPENKWDGSSKNNNPAPVGNYIWKAEFLDVQGFSHSMKGQVLLVR